MSEGKRVSDVFLCPENWEELHAETTIVDMHAHPALKAAWFRRDLTRYNPLAPNFIEAIGALFSDYFTFRASVAELIFEFDPLGFDPLSVRTDFPRLEAGGVDVLLSAVYSLEEESRYDFVVKLRPFKRLASPILGVTVPLLPPLLDSFQFIVRYGPVIRLLMAVFLNHLWSRYVKPDYFTVTQNMLGVIEDQARGSIETRVQVVRTVTELESLLNSPDAPIALVHSVEGAHSLEGKLTRRLLKEAGLESKLHFDRLDGGLRDAINEEVLANLKTFYERGVACLGLAHYYPNVVTATAFPYPERVLGMVPSKRWRWVWRDPTCGLTVLGERVVREMCHLGMLIDVRHASPAAREQVYAIVEGEGRGGVVVASHAGVSAMHPHPYNLEDWEIKRIADLGGVIGVHFSNYVLMGRDEAKLGLGYLLQTIDHLVNVGGIDCVAIGSDSDGFSNPLDEIAEHSNLSRLTQYLVAHRAPDGGGGRKYSRRDIKKILGGNALRVLLEGWRAGR